ncbi:MAG: choice-of-anchor Q domain-containing protein [Flavobacteriales bacterium]
MKSLAWTLPFLVLAAIFTNGCKKDIINSDGVLTFSEDTVLFDTVFTTIGSATRQFKIYNPSNDEVNISSIMLAGGNQSKYRMNLDGVPGIAFSNVSIPGKDSLFVFVDVTLDPNNLAQPAIITDSVIFNTNGIIQDVDLAAFGWDADFTFPTVFDNPIGPYTFLDCDVTWTPAEPHVIYGWAVVPGGCTLTIEAGTNVYSHKNSGIIVDEGGTLIVNGTPLNPVNFTSDRLEDFYEDQAGEWNSIWLYAGSLNNEIHGAVIKNGNIGVRVDSLAANSNPNLVMTNTIIENMAGVGMLSFESTIKAYNCVFGNAGQYSAALTRGGTYDFYHCTFANYWVNGNRQTPAVLLNNYVEADGSTFTYDLNHAYFGNCIVYGNNLTEVGIDRNNASNFNFEFDHCLMRIDLNDDEGVDVSNLAEFHHITYNENPEFVEPSEEMFALDSSISAAFDAGDISITNVDFGILGTDVLGNSRPFGSAPDLGAYERQE